MTTDPFQAAKQLHQSGRLTEAEYAYRQALAARPDDPGILHLLAALLDQRGDGDTALALLQRAVELRPDFIQARFNLARLLRRRGALGEAEAMYRTVVALAPGHIDARLELAGVLLRTLRLRECIAEYRAVLALAPDDPRALNNLGAALLSAGDRPGAEAALRQVLALNPHDREALNNLGNVLMELDRAAEAEACYRAALSAAPQDAQVRANLANALEKMGDAAGAQAAYRQCLAQGRNDGLRLRLAMTMPAIPQSVEEIERCRADAFAVLDELEAAPLTIADPFREVGSTAFYLAYQGFQDRAYQERLARLHARACPALLDRAPHCRLGVRRPGGRIRVGFVSTFLRNHTIGRLNRGLIAGLDRKRFEVTVFAAAPASDPIARAIHASADHAAILPAGLDASRKAIADAGMDVLYYADIGMVPLTYFLAFARLAPVQVTTWGHPLTTGIANIDHFISMDLAEPDDARAHYSENLARLPGLTTCYERPATPMPRPRAAFGLGEDRTVYLCPQSLFKLHPGFDAILGQILAGDPKAEIALLSGSQPQWTERLTARLARALPPEALRRVRFVPRTAPDDFLALLASADVILDTTVFCGGNTTLEALAMGTPVVTLPSPYLRGRLTLAMYRRMGFTDLVAKDDADYARIALSLGCDADRRAAARAAIRERAPVLFADRGAIRAQEELLLELVGG
ncbi:MAG: tetratricopeptide repeat protein [Alphaproteobacteria bacterium]|nr:tetratricopeptide repeat protein [Alphaproteobacteria bacterium]